MEVVNVLTRNISNSLDTGRVARIEGNIKRDNPGLCNV